MEGIVKSEIGKNLTSAFPVNGGNSAREAVGGSEGLSPRPVDQCPLFWMFC